MYHIHISAILGKLQMPWCRFLLTSDNINLLEPAALMIQFINNNMIHSQICSTQISVIPCHLHTADMRSEIPLCNAAKSSVKDLICDLTDRTIRINTECRQLGIMIACNK